MIATIEVNLIVFEKDHLHTWVYSFSNPIKWRWFRSDEFVNNGFTVSISEDGQTSRKDQYTRHKLLAVADVLRLIRVCDVCNSTTGGGVGHEDL
jgi:hypothetical protein